MSPSRKCMQRGGRLITTCRFSKFEEATRTGTECLKDQKFGSVADRRAKDTMGSVRSFMVVHQSEKSFSSTRSAEIEKKKSGAFDGQVFLASGNSRMCRARRGKRRRTWREHSQLPLKNMEYSQLPLTVCMCFLFMARKRSFLSPVRIIFGILTSRKDHTTTNVVIRSRVPK
jgi:hypothetical protein